MIANTRRNVVLPAIAAVLMIASSASAQSTYFKYELCSADKYVPASGVAIDRNFYKKYVNAGLMPVLSSSKVPGML